MPIDQIDSVSATPKPGKPSKKSRVAKKKTDGRLKKNRAHDIRWVAMYIEADPEKTPQPVSLTAAGMLTWARSSPENKAKFWSQMYPKLLAHDDRVAAAASAELKMRDGGEVLNQMWEALERERPDLAALSRKRIYGNTVNGRCRCPKCGTTYNPLGGPGESPSPSIGRVGAADQVEISQQHRVE